MAKLISNTYAEALFELALEKDKLDDLYAEVCLLSETYKQNPEFISLLTHPKITKEEKIKVIDDTMNERASEELTGLLKVIVAKDRAKEILSVFESFKVKYYECRKIGIVYITSAIELSDSQKKKIEARILEQTDFNSLETTYSVDDSLIGGMIIRIGDRVLDSSIKTKLDRMTQSLRKVSIGN